MKGNLLTIEEAAEYTGLCQSTLRRLQKRGELFPEKKIKAGPRGGLRSLYLKEDLDDLQAIYPKHNPRNYYTSEQAARAIGVEVATMRDFGIPHVKELRNGKWCNMYTKQAISDFLKKRRADEQTPPGYITYKEAAPIVGMHPSNIRRYSEVNRVRRKTYTSKGKTFTAYNKQDIIRWATERKAKS